jgi:hypothetical protein
MMVEVDEQSWLLVLLRGWYMIFWADFPIGVLQGGLTAVSKAGLRRHA